MPEPNLEVADIFRDHGAAWREANRGHVSLSQMKVMSAIERCRTSALGGHVARDEDAYRGRGLLELLDDLLLLLVCPLPEHLVALVHQLPALRAAVSGTVGVVLVGDGPYSANDIEASLGVRVFGTLPDDRSAAEVLRNGGSRSRLARSRLARSASALAGQIDLALDAPLVKVAV